MESRYPHPLCKEMTVVEKENHHSKFEDLVDASYPKSTAPATRKARKAFRKKINPELERKMAAYMTHELRAPLTSIRSALGILQTDVESRMTGKERHIFKTAIRNAARLDGLSSVRVRPDDKWARPHPSADPVLFSQEFHNRPARVALAVCER